MRVGDWSVDAEEMKVRMGGTPSSPSPAGSGSLPPGRAIPRPRTTPLPGTPADSPTPPGHRHRHRHPAPPPRARHGSKGYPAARAHWSASNNSRVTSRHHSIKQSRRQSRRQTRRRPTDAADGRASQCCSCSEVTSCARSAAC